MSRFGFRTAIASVATANECLEVGRQVLVAKGATPQVEGSVIKGRLGSYMKTRMIGGAFVPESWLPTDVVISVVDYGTQRQVVVDVSEAIGFGVLIGVERKLKSRCSKLATELQGSIGERLPGSQPVTLPAAPTA